jgi:hypothetical protein
MAKSFLLEMAEKWQRLAARAEKDEPSKSERNGRR